ncbi:hypothetical protein AB0O47_39930 [Streptomyces noursei]|uniref:hypothetical protein n=1 Tax=Streptomyces noursei TaxID=1971 RepID=UPI00344C4352
MSERVIYDCDLCEPHTTPAERIFGVVGRIDPTNPAGLVLVAGFYDGCPLHQDDFHALTDKFLSVAGGPLNPELQEHLIKAMRRTGPKKKNSQTGTHYVCPICPVVIKEGSKSGHSKHHGHTSITETGYVPYDPVKHADYPRASPGHRKP